MIVFRVIRRLLEIGATLYATILTISNGIAKTPRDEDETVEVTPDEEPEEDENPKTGLALALVPMMIAAAVAVITKK